MPTTNAQNNYHDDNCIDNSHIDYYKIIALIKTCITKPTSIPYGILPFQESLILVLHFVQTGTLLLILVYYQLSLDFYIIPIERLQLISAIFKTKFQCVM